jgi:RNA polymerase sigma factor (sigma-70 family)
MDLDTAALVRHLRRLATPSAADDVSDALLLDRFVRRREEAAFAALVSRHGPMVLRVCRRVLADPHAAEDAFQATFLVLARRAGAIRRPAALVAWLHGVAHRVAVRARVAGRRRRLCEVSVPDVAAPDPRPDPLAELTARDLLAVLDEEVQRLPEVYRLPIILCCLEGRTQEEAARLLGWTSGSVKGRLERGRLRLHARLTRRRLTLSAALAGAELSRGVGAAVSGRLAALAVQGVATTGAGAGEVATRVAGLAGEGVKGAAAARTKVILVLMALALGVGGAGVVGHCLLTGKQSEPGRQAAPRQQARGQEGPAPKAAAPARTDRYGDPLPPGSVARLGTVRFRHDGEATALAFAPDGATLASVCSGEVILWDSATGRERRRLPIQVTGGGLGTGPLDFSPDGRILAVADPREGLSLWDAAGGERLRTLPLPPDETLDGCRSVRFAPGGDNPRAIGKTVAVAVGTRAHLLDAATGKVRARLDTERSGVDDVAFAPDGKTVALATADPSVQLWDLGTAKLIRRFGPDKENLILRVAFAPDGKLLAAGSRHGILLWDPATGAERGRLEARMGAVVGLAFTPDGRTLLSASEDSRGRVWDVTTRKLRHTLDARGLVGRCLALSRDGKRVALGTAYGAIRVWEVDTGKELLTEFDGPDTPVHCVTFSPDGQTLAVGAGNGQTRLWDTTAWRQSRQLAGTARTLSYSADGKRLATVPHDKSVHVWDLATGTEAFQVRRPETYDLQAACFAGDGRLLVSLDRERPAEKGAHGVAHLVVWDGGTGKRLRQSDLPDVWPECLAVAPDGRTAFVGDSRGRVHVRDLEAGQEPMLVAAHEHMVGGLTLSADGRTLISGSLDRSVRVWEVVTGKEIFTLRGHQYPVSAVALSPDGRLAASADSDPGYSPATKEPLTIRLWDLATGAECGRFQVGHSMPTALAFSADGSRLVSGLRNGTALVWDVAAVRLPAPKRLETAELTGLWVALAGADASAARRAMWILAESPGQAVALLKERITPAAVADPAQVRRWITDLDSDEFAARAAAAGELEKLGQQAVPALREALEGKPSPEVRRRAESLLDAARQVGSPELLRRLRAVAVLERIGSREAHAVLDRLAGGAEAARETREARASLQRLDRRPEPSP